MEVCRAGEGSRSRVAAWLNIKKGQASEEQKPNCTVPSLAGRFMAADVPAGRGCACTSVCVWT